MRDITFRAWNTVLQYMGRVSLLAFHDDGTIKAFEVIDDKPIFERKGKEGYGKLEDFVLMQYTGLKDKNGKEIYEGDIVEVLEKGVHYIAEVSYARSGFFMMLRVAMPTFGRIHFSPENDSNIDQGVEVIGNIYENPELLTIKIDN